jgi:uncharacterized membrane protein YdjX (TVP38/TMEM64 family)
MAAADPSKHYDAPAGGPAEGATNEPGAVRRFLPLLLLVAGLAGFFAFDLHHYVSFAALADHRDTLNGWVERHAVLAPVAFVAVYALAVAFSVPGGAVLTAASGFLFGTVAGAALAVVGATAGAVAVFLAARTALGDTLRRRTGPWLRRLEDGFRDNALSYLLVLRLMPLIPFWLVNLVPAFLGVPLRIFVLGTLVGIIPGTLIFASVGNGLGAVLDTGRQPDAGILFEPEILLPLIGLSVLALIPMVYRRLKGKKEHE